MVILTERSQPEQLLVDALRASFDASVMNFGSYNILCTVDRLGAPADTGAARAWGGSLLLVGYRREPIEIVLCPVDLDDALSRVETLRRGEEPGPAAAAIPTLVNLTNLAGMASQDNVVEVTLSTGRRTKLDLHSQVRFDQFPETALHQGRDVADFYEFIDYFMDVVERMNAA
ncbi:hypothetical protein BG28_05590 [Nesterenkonia sp. AN1]|uniref:Uncharacterized protein n=1 Tax=Nesterenkonia aurantiaca TaxID=1436010 RepID=A0A4R7G430_9MICC|nr:hypothetical protein [Nesterenkonia]EXF24567.1 hypothetical protein BG28_05590 [Nesterenkonia sp. AN1]TDS86115.1 hypothetical protein EV640_104139 [Nesterenkonia aurantiaca]